MWSNVILFISSYIPLYVLLILKGILERITNEGHFINIAAVFMDTDWLNECLTWATLLLIVVTVVSWVYLAVILSRGENNKSYVIRSIEDKTGNFYFSYVSVYLLPCLGLSLNRIVDCFVLLFVMLIIGYIYIAGNLIYINPIATLMGYRIYDCVLDSEHIAKDKDIRSIVFAPKSKKMTKGDRIMASPKQKFIFVKKDHVHKSL